MTPAEEQALRRWGEHLSAEPSLVLWTSGDPRTRELEAFCTELVAHAPRVRVVECRASDGDLPGLGLGRVTYRGVPLGKELAPFLGVLEASRHEAIDKEPTAPRLKLYVAQQCPHCPRVFSTLASVAQRLEVGLDVVDVVLFEEVATADRAGAVPTLIVDGKLRMVGNIAAHDVEPLLASPHTLRASSLRLLLENGNAVALGAMMRERGRALPALVDLLTEATFSVRLGAMALVEEVADDQPALVAQLADPLWERFAQASNEVRGDLLYVFGKTRDSRLMPRLQAVIDGEYAADVKEAAEDALEELEEAAEQ